MKSQVKIINEITKLRFKISKQKELINYYEVMSHSLGGSDYSTERVDGTRNLEAPFVKWIYKKIDAEEKLKVMEDDLEAKVNELSTLLDKLEQPEYQMVLTYRYVLNMDWVDIPKVMNYSISSVYRLHRDALYALKIMIVRDS